MNEARLRALELAVGATLDRVGSKGNISSKDVVAWAQAFYDFLESTKLPEAGLKTE